MTDYSRAAFDLFRDHFTVPNAIDNYRRTFDLLCDAGVKPSRIITDVQQSSYSHQRPLIPRLVLRVKQPDLVGTPFATGAATRELTRYNHLPTSPRAPAPFDALLAEGQWMDVSGSITVFTEAMLTGEQLDQLEALLETWRDADTRSPNFMGDLCALAETGHACEHMRYPTADNTAMVARPYDTLPLPDSAEFFGMLSEIGVHAMVLPDTLSIMSDNSLRRPIHALTHNATMAIRGDRALPYEVRSLLPDDIMVHERPYTGSKPGLVAFFDSPRKAWLNQPTEMRIGRYLRRHLKDVHDEDIKQMAADFTSRGTIEVAIAETETEFREVYLNGPQSCMKYGSDTFTHCYDEMGEWRHPVEAYVHPESHIRLAYTLGGDGRIGARALINQRNNTFPRVYGSDHSPRHKEALMQWLRDNDYMHDDNGLEDEPMQIITLSNGGILCPYIDDGNMGVRLSLDEDDDTMYIGGPHEVCHSDGYFLRHGGTCDHCDRNVHNDELNEIHASTDQICSDCLEGGGDFVRAVNTYSDVVWARRYDTWRAPMTLTTSDCQHVDFVTDDHSDDELQEHDLALVGGTLYDRDETIERGDRNERVLRNRVLTPDDDQPIGESFAEVEGEAWPLGECYFDEDEDEWRLIDSVDLSTMVQGDAPHCFRARTEDDELDISSRAA